MQPGYKHTLHAAKLVGSSKLQVSSAKEPYKRDDILQKRPIQSTNILYMQRKHLQGGEDPWDALSLKVIFRKRAILLVAFL